MMSLPNRVHAVVELNVGLAAPADHYVAQPRLLQPHRILETAMRAFDVDLEGVNANVTREVNRETKHVSRCGLRMQAGRLRQISTANTDPLKCSVTQPLSPAAQVRMSRGNVAQADADPQNARQTAGRSEDTLQLAERNAFSDVLQIS